MITVGTIRAALAGLDDEVELLWRDEAARISNYTPQAISVSTRLRTINIGKRRLWLAEDVHELALARRTRRRAR